MNYRGKEIFAINDKVIYKKREGIVVGYYNIYDFPVIRFNDNIGNGFYHFSLLKRSV